MATKQTVRKTQAVRDYLDAHPGAGCREIATALDNQGIKITLNHVATIKAVMYETAETAADTASRGEACHRHQYAHARTGQDGCPSDKKDTVTQVSKPLTAYRRLAKLMDSKLSPNKEHKSWQREAE